MPKPSVDIVGMEDGILDGELCAVGPDGPPDFSLLKGSTNTRGSGRLIYFPIDILWRGEGASALQAVARSPDLGDPLDVGAGCVVRKPGSRRRRANPLTRIC